MKEAWKRWKESFADMTFMLVLVYIAYGSLALFAWIIGALK